MLKSLAVSNFAVIHHLTLDLGGGLNVISGETGAGKSILVDSLGLILGGRGRADLLRRGEERLRVEALFEVVPGTPAARWLEEQFPGQSAGGEVLLRRELGSDGRSRAWIGTSPATLATLREAASGLVEIQGQHEQQGLLDAAAQRDWLDAFGALSAQRRAVEQAHGAMRELQQRLAEVEGRERERLQRLDLLRFQLQEVAQVGPRPGEDEELRAERDRIRHAERLRAAAGEALALLYENEDSVAALAGRARARLLEVAALDPSFTAGQGVEEAAALLADAAHALSSYLEGLEHDPRRLEQVEDRWHAIETLKRKYGGSVDEVLALAQGRRSELEALERSEQNRAQDARRLEEAEAAYWEAAQDLSRARRAAAGELSTRVSRELGSLAMPRARFEVRFGAPPPPWPQEHRPEPGPAGADTVEFYLAPNVGEGSRPLAATASGGELSRVLLALHVSLERGGPARTLVYDEVDAGVGADVAIAVGEKLRRVARRHQVLCVTHMHPVAAVADRHLKISKHAEGGRTEVRVRELGPEERVQEILRMMGGHAAGAAGRRAAAEWVRRREVTPT